MRKNADGTDFGSEKEILMYGMLEFDTQGNIKTF